MTGGATFGGPGSAVVTILDDDVGMGFSSPVFLATEKSSIANLSLTRIGTNGTTSVQYYTTNATAQAGTNYVASSGTVTFSAGESLKFFSISLLHDPRVTPATVHSTSSWWNLSAPSPSSST